MAGIVPLHWIHHQPMILLDGDEDEAIRRAQKRYEEVRENKAALWSTSDG